MLKEYPLPQKAGVCVPGMFILLFTSLNHNPCIVPEE